VHRLNTYPLSHQGFFHALLNILALTPLLERFEAENGTLVTLILFTGRKSYFQKRDLMHGMVLTQQSILYLSGFDICSPGEGDWQRKRGHTGSEVFVLINHSGSTA